MADRLAATPDVASPLSNPGDTVLDFFAGSGTPTGEAAARNGRHYILVDSSPEAARVMTDRLAGYEPLT